MICDLTKNIQTKLKTLTDDFNMKDITTDNIIIFFKYEGDINNNISKLYTILYFLLDYEDYITLENFTPLKI